MKSANYYYKITALIALAMVVYIFLFVLGGTCNSDSRAKLKKTFNSKAGPRSSYVKH